ncbi:MAG: hypothetical protein QM706_15915 [Nitrospira sp.]
MTYSAIVGTRVSYRVEVEAESFSEAAEKALEYVNAHIESGLCTAARSLVPDGINDSTSTVEIIEACGAYPSA